MDDAAAYMAQPNIDGFFFTRGDKLRVDFPYLCQEVKGVLRPAN